MLLLLALPQTKVVVGISRNRSGGPRATPSRITATVGKFPAFLVRPEFPKPRCRGRTLAGKIFPAWLPQPLAPAATPEELRPSLQEGPPPLESEDFFLETPYREYPLLLGFSLLGMLGGTLGYLREGFLLPGVESVLLLLLTFILALLNLRKCPEQQLSVKPAKKPIVGGYGNLRSLSHLGILLLFYGRGLNFFFICWAYLHSPLNPNPELLGPWPFLGLMLLLLPLTLRLHFDLEFIRSD
jgi:hypothetical protein